MEQNFDGTTVGATVVLAQQGQIVATLVADAGRMDFLPSHFGPLYLLAENTVFNAMARLCPHYTGGFWSFYHLSNGGAFLAPDDLPTYRLVCDGNGFDGLLDAKVAGIGVSAMALSRLSFGRDGAHFAELYYRLRDFIHQQPEAAQLYRLLD